MQEFGEGEIPNENYTQIIVQQILLILNTCNILVTEKAGDVNV